MFESIVAKISNAVRNAVRHLGLATRRSPWLAPAIIIALVLTW